MDLLIMAQPTGLWESILFWLESFVGNYAIAIILITLIIKVVLLPIDFLNKYITKKNTIKQALMKPELDKIKLRYGKNPEMLNKKTMELYKAKGYKMGGMCGMMLAYMAVTMVVFFTLLGSLNTVSYYKMYNEYESVKVAYTETYNEIIDSGMETPEGYESLEEYALSKAGEKTVEVYEDVRTGFLWIKSIWRPDTSSSPIMDYNTFASNVGKLEGANLPKEDEYNEVMAALMQSEDYASGNGWYLLCILAALATFGSTYINTLVQKFKAKKRGDLQETMEVSSKGMTLVMPVIMGIFTLFYTASFGLYIVTSSIFGMASGVVMSILVDKLIIKQAKKEKQRVLNSYDRSNLN